MEAGKGAEEVTIAALSVYREEWTLKAKVWKKSKVQFWKNQRSAGKLFHANLVDSQGDEISSTFFNSAVDQFFPLLQENHIYIFSKGKLLKSNPKFRTVSCDLHINFDSRAEITEIADESQEIASLPVTLRRLDEIPGLVRGGNMCFVSVCAVVIDKGTMQDVVSRQGAKLQKRELTICDNGEFPMKLTLWGEEAAADAWEQDSKNPILVLALKVQTSVFRESLVLNTNMTASKVILNPKNCPEADSLLLWWSHRKTVVSSLESVGFATIQAVESQPLSQISAKAVFRVAAFVNYIRNDADTQLWYESCLNSQKCKKKVRKVGEFFRCDTCDEQFPQCKYRFCASIRLCDETGGLWATAFDSPFEELVGLSAQAAKDMSETNSEELGRKVGELFNVRKTFVVEKRERAGGKVRYTIEGVEEIDERRRTKRLIEEMERMIAEIRG